MRIRGPTFVAFLVALALLALARAFAGDGTVGSRLVALVGEKPLTTSDLANWLRLHGIQPAEATREEWRRALVAAVDRAILLEAAEREGIEVSEQLVAAGIRAWRSGPWAAEYEREVRLLQLDTEGEKARMRERLRVDGLLSNRLGPRLFVSPKAMSEWYEAHKDTLAEPETRNARVITIKPKDGEAAAECRKRAEAIWRQLRDGSDFAELARQHSADPWAEKGGELEPLQKGESGSIFAERVFDMREPGEVSDVFETEQGFHILKLTSMRPAFVPEFKAVQEDIRRRLVEEMRAQHVPALAKELQQKTMVRIFWDHVPSPRP